MLSDVLAHAGRPLEPHDLWAAWNLDPLLLGGLLLAAWAYGRGRVARADRTARAARIARTAQAGHRAGRSPAGRGPTDRLRAACFAGGLAAVAVALVSPLDALSGALASAHMVQHMLLLLVAAPLLALGRPLAVMRAGVPPRLRAAQRRLRRILGGRPGRPVPAGEAVAVWLAHVAVLWFWHAAVPYDAALRHHVLHVVEHATFLASGVLFWWLVVGLRPAERVAPGAGVLLVFAMALQSVFLAALLTFAPSPWYPAYATTTAGWGLDPLADQQLAGAIMWIPAGLIHVGAGLALLVAWVRTSEADTQRISLASPR